MLQEWKILKKIKIPNNINYDKVLNLATEAKDKLKIIKPETIAQAIESVELIQVIFKC